MMAAPATDSGAEGRRVLITGGATGIGGTGIARTAGGGPGRAGALGPPIRSVGGRFGGLPAYSLTTRRLRRSSSFRSRASTVR